jgi:hypothetical protein
MSTYVQFTRQEFEDWLATLGYRWRLKPQRKGVYQLMLSDSVAIEVHSSMTGRDDVMDHAAASMSVSLVSLVTGLALNKVAQGQTHFKRTTNWRVNLAKGVKRMEDAYRKSSAFYDALALITDRKAYKRDLMAKIESISGWDKNSFLSDLHSRLDGNGILTIKQQEALERAVKDSQTTSKAPTISQGTDPDLLRQVRALYLIAKAEGNEWMLQFTESVGKMLAAGRTLTDRQMSTLVKLVKDNNRKIQEVMRSRRLVSLINLP